YYPKVVVTDVEDIEWLKKLHIGNIEWILTDKWPLLSEWTALPITKLIQSRKANYRKGWTTILPQLQHLTSLQVATNDRGAISDVCAFAAQSRTLVELAIICDHGSMTFSAVDHLVEWFNRQPVRLFDYRGYAYQNPQNYKLFQAIFDCPTLETVKLSGFNLRGADIDEITLFMKSLTLRNCMTSYDFISRLTKRLEGSKTTQLSLEVRHDFDVTGIYYLFENLRQTSIKHLELRVYCVRIMQLCELTPLIARCSLESLSLHVSRFSKTLAKKLAHAIQQNQSICELDLKRCAIAFEDIRLMIQSITHASRKVKARRIKLDLYNRSFSAERVDELEQLAIDLGGELVIVHQKE
ncbi:hypothetical protein AeNC1_019701, partial [Aphanomyces euteiches]